MRTARLESAKKMKKLIRFNQNIRVLERHRNATRTTKVIFTIDDVEIPTKYYPNFVEVSTFRFSEISILMSKSEFRFGLRFLSFTFDEIEIPKKIHFDSAAISISEFRV
jgi:hypothetical protein